MFKCSVSILKIYLIQHFFDQQFLNNYTFLNLECHMLIISFIALIDIRFYAFYFKATK